MTSRLASLAALPVACVVPLHNHARWIVGCLDALAAQVHPAKRAVVVDDGSTDGGLEVVLGGMTGVEAVQGLGVPAWAGYHHGLPTLVLRHEQARGPAAARNAGVKALWENTFAFAFCDSDDLYGPTKISRSLALMAGAPDEVGVVYTDYDTLGPDGLRLRQFKAPYSREHLLRECIVNCDSLVSKAALEAVGGFDESMRVCEDYELWVRLTEKYFALHLPEPLLTVRVGPHSSTARVPTPEWQRCHARVFEKLKARQR